MTIHPDGPTLNDFADEALPRAAQAEVREHLASCAECQAAVEGLRGVRAAARALPTLQPRREAWDRIEREIRAGRPRRIAPMLSWLAAAAAIVFATFVGFKIADLRHQSAMPSASSAPATAAAGARASAQDIEAELLQAEQHYQKAIAGLEQIANAEKGALDPQTASTLEKNLTVIDQAISESRAALRAQPASEPAQASLLESFKSKISLLQDTVALINEMRKSNPDAGAARLVSGLEKKGT
jgi:hypothetical protein